MAFKSLQNRTDKLEASEKDVEELKGKHKCNKNNVCHLIVVASG